MKIDPTDLDRLGITDPDHLSAATIRALQWPKIGNEPFGALKWGLTHQYMNDDYQYIRRFHGYQVTTHVAKGEAQR